MRIFAASIAAMVVLSLVGYRLIPTEHLYQTAVGERSTLTLPDGSEITLNTDTQAHVRYTLRTRAVELERGQAHFKVARSQLRPFLVDAGTGIIRAVGTEFDVYRKNDEVRISLIEGKVTVTPLALLSGSPQQTGVTNPEVSAQSKPGHGDMQRAKQPRTEVSLTAGQSLSLTPAGIAPAPPGPIEEATAWLDGKLIFTDERLCDAVSEVNRYSTQKIVVLDGELADLRVNGIFRTDRADTFIEAVRTSLPVAIQGASGGTLVIVPDPKRDERSRRSH